MSFQNHSVCEEHLARGLLNHITVAELVKLLPSLFYSLSHYLTLPHPTHEACIVALSYTLPLTFSEGIVLILLSLHKPF